MATPTVPLVTTALIIFAVLFVVSGVLVIVRQYLRYHYRAKLLNDVEKGRTRSTAAVEGPPRPQPRDCTKSRPQHPTISPTQGLGKDRKYDTKPLPPHPPHPPHSSRPQKPAPTARAVPSRVAPDPVKIGLGVHSDLPTPSPNRPTFEQSYFSEDDEEDDHKREGGEKDRRWVKSWFPPKPRRVSLQRPQVVKSASRLSQRLSQLRGPPPRTPVEMADVPIVSTPRDLRIDPPPAAPASRVLGSPFQYHRRQSSDKRETVIGPDVRHTIRKWIKKAEASSMALLDSLSSTSGATASDLVPSLALVEIISSSTWSRVTATLGGVRRHDQGVMVTQCLPAQAYFRHHNFMEYDATQFSVL
ncbi:hypothetical protein LTR70_010543 [Exophiala xenobiotica]|uniref:Uncharacterized protein n=1 Tax=Lithohypha guttulata TaxID=1690604 RepID=A0ABR0JTX7_9EURO|nr:hypothetical protein LTR24_010519 [Lithohypha guttulata]KAK5309180.1 hypothetical protein LTR70_010543 [Exophiala xenobiotica]